MLSYIIMVPRVDKATTVYVFIPIDDIVSEQHDKLWIADKKVTSQWGKPIVDNQEAYSIWHQLATGINPFKYLYESVTVQEFENFCEYLHGLIDNVSRIHGTGYLYRYMTPVTPLKQFVAEQQAAL